MEDGGYLFGGITTTAGERATARCVHVFVRGMITGASLALLVVGMFSTM